MTCRSSYRQWMEEWQSTATRHCHWSTVRVIQPLPHLTCPTVSAPVFQDREECTSSSPRSTIPTGCLLWDTHFRGNTRLSGVRTMASDILKMHFFPFLCHWQYSVPWSTMTKRSRKYCSQSAQFSHSVVSNSLWPHGLQHARLPCPSPTPRAYSKSCLLSLWCHPTISSSVIPFSSCLQFFLASGYFPMSQFFILGGQSIGVSTSASVLPMNIQDWFPLGWTIWSPCCPRDSWESSPIPQFKSINSSALSLFYVPTLTSVHEYWKNHSFDKTDLLSAKWCLCFLICCLGWS